MEVLRVVNVERPMVIEPSFEPWELAQELLMSPGACDDQIVQVPERRAAPVASVLWGADGGAVELRKVLL